MIRSGLVNTRKGGGFEEGFAHERDARNSVLIRPYVTLADKGYSEPSDFKTIVPLPVSYAHIFSKTLTPSERLYEAKRLKRGAIKKNIRKLKPYEKQEEPGIEPVDGAERESDTIVREPVDREISLGEQLGGVTAEGEDTTWAQEWEDRNKLYAEELGDVEVVYNPPHDETFDEEMHAEEMWEKRMIDTEMTDVVENHKHTKDDIVMTTENNFGAGLIKDVAKVYKETRKPPRTNQVEMSILANGIGPRHRVSKKQNRREDLVETKKPPKRNIREKPIFVKSARNRAGKK